MTDLMRIELAQLPVITHHLQEVGKQVDARIASLDLDKQVATVDTVKVLKELRAELNKELNGFEEQRKFVKGGIMNPYQDFEAVYKEQISEKYTVAINLLKDKIATVENQVKAEKQAAVKTYWQELCVSEGIDFIPFEKLGLEINLSTSMKAYKDKCNEFIVNVLDDLALIKTNPYEAEVLVEYKNTLNCSKAITEVQERKQKEAAEQERLRRTEINRRIAICKGLGMVFVDITNAYELDADIYITSDQIEKLSREDFEKEVIMCEEAIKIKAQEKQKAAAREQGAPEPVKQEPATPAIPVTAPTVEKKAELLTASFKVTGTMEQLRNLGAYMKTNGITYQNI